MRKDCFPSLLRNTITLLSNLSETIISGFRTTGIYPTNRELILKRLPENVNDSSNTEEPTNRAAVWTEGIINVLDTHRKSATEVKQRRRHITVEAGKSLAGDDEEENVEDDPEPILADQPTEPADEEMPLHNEMLEPVPSTSSAQPEVQIDTANLVDSVSLKKN